MGIKSLLVTLIFAAAMAVPAGAETGSTAKPAERMRQLSPALRKKLAERAAALRADAAAPTGPSFDRQAVNWTIDTPSCSLVKSQVQGAGFKGHTAWLTMNDDGSFHAQIRTEASGTAVDASGNNYIWIYNDLAELDSPDPNANPPMVTGYGPDTFQLIPLTAAGGAGYTVTGFLQVTTPMPFNSIGPPLVNAPPGCLPL